MCILAQRLVRVNCPECKEAYTPPPDEILALGLSLEEGAKKTFYRGRGCNNCRSTGFKGRTGVYELLNNAAEIKEVITHNRSALELAAAARAQGMRTMMEDGLDKVLRGITTASEVIRAVYTAATLDTARETPAEDEITQEMEPGDEEAE